MIITTTNKKGGTGKTTLNTLLAEFLYQHGQKVLIIGLDPNCSISEVYGKVLQDQNSKLLLTGREVLVETELKTSSWEKDGKKYSRTEIRASRVRPLRRPGEGKRTNNEQPQNSYSQAPSYTSAPPQAPNFDDMPPDDMADEGDPEGIPF